MWWAREPRVVVRPSGGHPAARPVDAPGTYALAGVEVTVADAGGVLTWTVTNPSGARLALDAVALEFDAGPGRPGDRWYCHGYQSWSPTRTRRLGVDEDPSRAEGSIARVRAAYHADPGIAAPGELRSEQVALLATSDGLRCYGFDGGERHAGTFRARLAGDRVRVAAEAWLGGAVLPPGTSRDLHGVRAAAGDDAAGLLATWAGAIGARARARVAAPYRVGWCSWYHYFHGVDEAAVRHNLAHARDWPFAVFQVDDGFQATIGDWLSTNDRFPSGVAGIADVIGSAGLDPGLWLAPFLAAPASQLAAAHPDWFARDPDGDRPAIGMVHDVWGGVTWQLDTTHPGVQAHLAAVAAALVDAGYRHLKLDFTFAAALPARVHDPTATPAERVRAGFDAIRRGAGDDAFLVGCGCPLGPVVGAVDAMRVGPDVAPTWEPLPGTVLLPGYEDAAPATRHALVNTLTRAFQHRRLWLNDPDCLMLRSTQTRLDPDAVRAWSLAVGCSGGLALVSDDLAALGQRARATLAEVVRLGRDADRSAQRGDPPRGEDLLAATDPTTLTSGGHRLRVDPDLPRGVVTAA